MRESALLRHIHRSAVADAVVLIPSGDDMAMVQLDTNQVLTATDQLVAGRHFQLASTPVGLIGRKAITRCLSDIAAMAATPVASLAAAALSPDLSERWCTELFDAMHLAASTYGCPLIGGDIALLGEANTDLVCTVTVLATPGPTPPVRRSGAQDGDNVYVTGRLGGSLEPDGLGRHLEFEPRIPEALQLADQLGARLHAMIDISDGLGRDAGHVAEASSMKIVLDADSIPCAAGVDWRRALSDGEDYELCFTASGDVPANVGELKITKVGEVRSIDPNDAPTVLVRAGEQLHDASTMGWEHAS